MTGRAVRRCACGASSRPSRFVTIPELCADLEITRSTFYDWRAKRKAPRCRKLPNGEIRIDRDVYEAWLATLEETEA